jgi:hypothetical protein
MKPNTATPRASRQNAAQVTEGEGQRVGRVGRGLRVKPQGVTHDIGDLPLLRTPVTYHRRLHTRRLDLHDLASPTAERNEQRATGFRKGEGSLWKAAGERRLDGHHVRCQATNKLPELIGE